MHNSTSENKTRDATLNGDLNREECDEEEVYEFLRSLKMPKRSTYDDNDCMQNNEWRMVVKNAKK